MFALDSSRAKVTNRFRKNQEDDEEHLNNCYASSAFNGASILQLQQNYKSHAEARGAGEYDNVNQSAEYHQSLPRSIETSSDVSSKNQAAPMESSALNMAQDALEQSLIKKEKEPGPTVRLAGGNPYAEQHLQSKHQNQLHDDKR